MNTFIKQDQR